MIDVTPSFPITPSTSEPGMMLRDWFATFAPEPSDKEIERYSEQDRIANPHGYDYKPQRRSRLEIVADLKYAYADVMMARRSIEKDR